MADITLKGNPFHTCGDLPSAGSQAPAFTLVGQDLAEVTLEDHAGKTCVLSIFPSVDTPVCAVSVRTFSERASAMACTTSASGTVSSTDMLSHRPELRDLATRQPSAGLSGTMAGHTASWQTGRDQTCKDESGIRPARLRAAALQ